MPDRLHPSTCSICLNTFLSWCSDEEVVAGAVAERGVDAYDGGAAIVCERCHMRYAHLVGAHAAFFLL